MELSDQYILFRKKKENKPKQSKPGVIEVDITSAHLTIGEAFSLAPESWSLDVVKMQCSFDREYENQSFQISIDVSTISEIYYVDITVIGADQKACITGLEYVERTIMRDRDALEKFSIIHTYDSASEYYCRLIYPKMGRYERLLRELFYMIYTLNYGEEYSRQLSTIKQRKKEKSGLDCFDRLSFSDYEIILFTPYSPHDSGDRINRVMSCADLTRLGDQDLRTLLEYVKPKSDWDRFFASKIPSTSIRGDLEELKVYRNDIAHNKLFNQTRYSRCSKLLDELIAKIEIAITITREDDIHRRYAENILVALCMLSERLDPLRQEAEENMKNVLKTVATTIGNVGLSNAE